MVYTVERGSDIGVDADTYSASMQWEQLDGIPPTYLSSKGFCLGSGT